MCGGCRFVFALRVGLVASVGVGLVDANWWLGFFLVLRLGL